MMEGYEKEIRNALPIKPNNEVMSQTFNRIQRAQGTDQMYLRTRFDKLNETLTGGFWKGRNILLSGLSGHGKSYFIRMLHQDFTNPELNGNVASPIVNLHFSFEMDVTEEGIRDVQAATGFTYAQLNGVDGKLSQAHLKHIYDILAKYAKDNNTYWVDETGTVEQVEQTIYDLQNALPNHLIITTLDHGLLTEKRSAESEVDMMANLAKMFVRVRQRLANINILVGQLKDTIEDPKRMEIGKQFPRMLDIFGSKQVFHAMDVVLVIHRPEMLGIDYYGKAEENALETYRMVALHILKNRFGQPNKWIALTEDFANGTMVEYQGSSLFSNNF